MNDRHDRLDRQDRHESNNNETAKRRQYTDIALKNLDISLREEYLEKLRMAGFLSGTLTDLVTKIPRMLDCLVTSYIIPIDQELLEVKRLYNVSNPQSVCIADEVSDTIVGTIHSLVEDSGLARRDIRGKYVSKIQYLRNLKATV